MARSAAPKQRGGGILQAIESGRSPVGQPEYTRASQSTGRFVRHNIWISDDAWLGIHKLMAERGHGRNGVRRWLSNLPADPTQYTDTRPAWLRDASLDNLEAGTFARMPLWTLELPRLPRTIWAESGTWIVLLYVARYWHISNHQRADSTSSEISRVGALLEAIGLGHLTIRYEPS